MIKALFFDLDGTLLTSKKRIAEKSITALQACREKGIRIFAATGRPPLLEKMLYLSPDEACLLKEGGAFYNGGCICLNGEKNYIPVSNSIVQTAVSIINKFEDINFAIQMAGEKLCFRYEMPDDIYPLWGLEKNEALPYNCSQEIDIIKLVIFSSNYDRQLYELYNMLIHAINSDANVVLTSKGRSLEVNGRNVSKKTAIDTMVGLCGLQPDEVAVFGDDYNDIEMLKSYEFSIAMGNAEDEAKAAAGHVTLGNDEDGIYHALKNFLKL